MGIGGDGGQGESRDRVRPVPASNPAFLHSHIPPIVSVGESNVTAEAKLCMPAPLVTLVAMSRALRIHTAYYSVSILAPRSRSPVSLCRPRFSHLAESRPVQQPPG